jgi:hypothetical protein
MVSELGSVVELVADGVALVDICEVPEHALKNRSEVRSAARRMQRDKKFGQRMNP